MIPNNKRLRLDPSLERAEIVDKSKSAKLSQDDYDKLLEEDLAKSRASYVVTSLLGVEILVKVKQSKAKN